MNRPRFLLAAAVGAAVLVPSAVAYADADDRQPRPASTESGVTTAGRRTPGEWVTLFTNRARRERGLVPLRLVTRPDRAAGYQSRHQARINAMTHVGRYGGDAGDRLVSFGYRWSAWGENVAAGQRTAGDVYRAWMASPGHRANMLNPQARHIGVSKRKSASGRPYWTMVIARR